MIFCQKQIQNNLAFEKVSIGSIKWLHFYSKMLNRTVVQSWTPYPDTESVVQFKKSIIFKGREGKGDIFRMPSRSRNAKLSSNESQMPSLAHR